MIAARIVGFAFGSTCIRVYEIAIESVYSEEQKATIMFGTPRLTLMVSAGLVARVANMAADIPETVCIMALGRPSPDFHELRPETAPINRISSARSSWSSRTAGRTEDILTLLVERHVHPGIWRIPSCRRRKAPKHASQPVRH